MTEQADPFEIFEPLSGTVNIATYGITNADIMQPVIDKIDCSASRLLVGYTKASMHMGVLFNQLREYEDLGIYVKVLPSCHLKIWSVLHTQRGYIGSCNFVPSTIVNYMASVGWDVAQYMFNFYWALAHDPFRHDTDLLKLPQTQQRHYAK